MTVLASAVASANDHGYEAGRFVARHALAAFQKAPPSLLVASISEQYDLAEVVRGIRSIAGSIPLLACSAQRVITMAGPFHKGLGVLALCADDMQIGRALTTGLHQQPVPTAQATLARLQESLPDVQHDNRAALLVLADGLAGSSAIDEALQAASALLESRCVLVGTAAGSIHAARTTTVCIDDQVVADGFAAGLICSSAPIAIGLGQGAGAEAGDAAGQAARQAMAALENRPPAAALIVVGGSPSSAPPGGEAAPEIEQVRAVIGRLTPFVGMYNPAAIAPAAGTVACHTSAVLVCLFGAA